MACMECAKCGWQGNAATCPHCGKGYMLWDEEINAWESEQEQERRLEREDAELWGDKEEE